MAGTFRFLFLFSSFGPLYAIFAIKLHYNAGVSVFWEWLSVTLFATSLLVFIMIARSLRTDNGTSVEVSDIKSKDNEIFGYITTYIPPLLARDMSDLSTVLPLAVLYTVMFFAYMKLDAPSLNPYFIFFDYRIYEGKASNEKSLITIISKRRFSGTARLTLFEVADGKLYYCEGS